MFEFEKVIEQESSIRRKVGIMLRNEVANGLVSLYSEYIDSSSCPSAALMMANTGNFGLNATKRAFIPLQRRPRGGYCKHNAHTYIAMLVTAAAVVLSTTRVVKCTKVLHK